MSMGIDLKACIVRILKPDGSTAGTGFVITNKGLVATCAHVVEAAGGGPSSTVRIVFHATGQEATATIESEGWRPPDAEDTAFLQLSGDLPKGVVPATLGASTRRQGAQVQAFGYPELGQVEGLWGKGELIGPVTEANRPLLQLQSSEITAGFSGGPVWDVITGHVIGMVTQVAAPDRYGKLGEVAFAIPAETLADLRSLELAETDPLTRMRADYLASLRQRFEYLDLGGIAPRVQNRTVKLRMADIFVPLQARPEIESHLDLEYRPDLVADQFQDTLSEDDMELALRMLARSEREARPVDIPELLRRPRVVVLGDPGCGKSTLLRHVAYAIATGDTKAVGEAALARLPILVGIVEYSQARTADPTITLDRYVREVSEPKWAALFRAALDAGEALLLLDGLDEVIDAHQRKGIAEAIHAFAADYPGNQFLVTSRIVGYQAARLTGDFAHFTVQPLPPERIAEFVEKWYAAIERGAGEIELSEEARERVEELSETIRARPGIRRLAENPLLLTIIALVNWRGRKLPNRRVELYAHAAETLIESWPYQRVGVRLETERVIRLLSPVAYRIFAVRSAGDIDEDELLPVLTDVICRVDGVDQREADRYARKFLSQISEHSGIFRERGYDERGRRVFGFFHLTFAEYFTARYLAGLWEGLGDDAEARRTFLRKYAHVPRWREVMLLMAGDVGLRDNDHAERDTRLLGDILQLGSEYEDKLHRDLLLAGKCLANDLRVQPQAARYVLAQLLRIMPESDVGVAVQDIFRTMRHTSYITIVREGLLACLADEDLDVRQSAEKALEQISDTRVDSNEHNRFVDRHLALLQAKDASARASAAAGLGQLGNTQMGSDQRSRVVNGLLARLGDEDWNVRGCAAASLGRLGSALGNSDEHSQIVDELLVQLEDEAPWVRECAAEALGELSDVRLGSDQWNRVMDGLLGRLEDGSLYVRKGSAKALGQMGDARALEGLLARLEDEDWLVREHATRALGRLGITQASSGERAGIVDGLLAQLEDDDSSVRKGAAEALGQLGEVQVGCEERSRILNRLLIQLEDEDSGVRWHVVTSLGQLGGAVTDTKERSGIVGGLLTKLEDSNYNVQSSAAVSLGRLSDVWADSDEHIRIVGELLARLECMDSYLQVCAMEALGQLGKIRMGSDEHNRIMDGLLAKLKDESQLVRWYAARALGRIGDRRTVEGLLARLEDDDSFVRKDAYNALISILDRSAREPEVVDVPCEPQTVPGPWDD